MAAKVNQKEYLKKYLSSGDNDEKKKKKKKKPNIGPKTVKVIDDDIDLKKLRPVEDGEFDIFIDAEDAPQIAGIVDDRGPVDFSDKRKWKIIAADEDGELQFKSSEKENQHTSERDKRKDTKSSKLLHKSNVKNDSNLSDNDLSPPRKRKSKNHKTKSSDSSDSDVSPPRKTRTKKNKKDNESPDLSPPRRSKSDNYSKRNKQDDDSDLSLPRKNIKYDDLDLSPPRRNKKDDYSRSTHVKKSRKDDDSDLSPPRKHKMHKSQKDDKSSDLPPSGRNKRDDDSDSSLPRKSRKDGYLKSKHSKKNRRDNDSDQSPPRKRKQDDDSDLSPPRKSVKDDYSKSKHIKKSRREDDSDVSPPKKNRKDDYSNSRHSKKDGREDSDISPPRKYKEKDNYNVSPRKNNRLTDSRLFHKHKRYDDRNPSPPRRNKDSRRDSLDRSKRDRRGDGNDNHHKRYKKYEENTQRKEKLCRRDQEDENGTDTEDTTDDKRLKKTLSGKTAGLQDAKMLREETEAFKKREAEMFSKLSKEVSGVGQAAVVRDIKRGKKRDREVEVVEEREKQKLQKELNEKYEKWGRGLKQVEDREEKLKSDLYEMSKPLARYADDEDLDKHLREQEREGDPMLQYIKEKQIKEGKREPERPRYEGSYMPNRFGIRPGHRWDGVDRSNGYEKRWFDAQNAKLARQEEAYKWSTADM